MKKYMVGFLLTNLLSLNTFAQSFDNFNEFRKNQDQLEYDISRLNSISIAPAFPYPDNIIEIGEKQFNKKLTLLFQPKVYQGIRSHGYIACFMDEDKNLYSLVYDNGKVINDSVTKNFSNTTQAKYCGQYLKYAKIKNEQVLSDNNYIDDKTGNIKYRNDGKPRAVKNGEDRF